VATKAMKMVRGGPQRAGPRRMFVSWIQNRQARTVSEELKGKLDAVRGRDDDVVSSAQADQRASTAVLGGGTYDWTDFIALVDSSYVVANRADPDVAPSGDFAVALKVLQRAGGHAQRTVWAAVIEPLPWRRARVAELELGDAAGLRVLSNDATRPVDHPSAAASPRDPLHIEPNEIFATAPQHKRQSHLAAAVTQLLSRAD
jgi:hypothetical protein